MQLTTLKTYITALRGIVGKQRICFALPHASAHSFPASPSSFLPDLLPPFSPLLPSPFLPPPSFPLSLPPPLLPPFSPLLPSPFLPPPSFPLSPLSFLPPFSPLPPSPFLPPPPSLLPPFSPPPPSPSLLPLSLLTPSSIFHPSLLLPCHSKSPHTLPIILHDRGESRKNGNLGARVGAPGHVGQDGLHLQAA